MTSSATIALRVPELHIVTGAFGYTGRYIAEELLSRGHRVRTLTNSTHRPDPFGGRVEVHPIDFGDHAALTASLRGAAAFYNTYWVRYDHGDGPRTFGYAQAVQNTRSLFGAARDAAVPRVVHVSVANAERGTTWDYFREKAQLERELRSSGVSHAIVRPTIVFGGERNVFINNIAWMLRHFPVFGLVGRGRARVTPIHVRDVARVCVDAAKRRGDEVVDAGGPETITYRDMVRTISRGLGVRRLILPMPAPVVIGIGWILGKAMGDVVITSHEISGLRDELMFLPGPAVGRISLAESVSQERDTLGRTYRNDLAERVALP